MVGSDRPNRSRLAHVLGVYLPTKDENDANARLIAASPELFEALAGIKWRSDDKDNMEFAARITYSQMDAIRAALARARGK